MFSYISKVLFSGYLQFRGNFVDGQNNSEYRDAAPQLALVVKEVIFRLSLLKDEEVYMPETYCTKRSSLYIKNMCIKRPYSHKFEIL